MGHKAKHLEIHLTKGEQDFCNENYKTVLKEIKHKLGILSELIKSRQTDLEPPLDQTVYACGRQLCSLVYLRGP